MSKQGKNAVAVLAFFEQKKAQMPALRVTEQPILLRRSKINRPAPVPEKPIKLSPD